MTKTTRGTIAATLATFSTLFGLGANAAPQTFFETYGPYGVEGHYETTDLKIESIESFGSSIYTDGSTVSFRMSPLEGITFFPLYSLHISTRNLGIALTPGTYTNAERFAYASPGHPELDFSAYGQGFNTLTGGFTIYDATFDARGKIATFAASYHIGEPQAIIQSGRIWFNSDVPTSVPEAGTAWMFLGGALGLAWVLRRHRQPGAVTA